MFSALPSTPGVTQGKTLNSLSPCSLPPLLAPPVFAAQVPFASQTLPSGRQTLPNSAFLAKSPNLQDPCASQIQENLVHVPGVPSREHKAHSQGCTRDVAPFLYPADAVLTLNTNGNISTACLKQKHSYRLPHARDQPQLPFLSLLWFLFQTQSSEQGWPKKIFKGNYLFKRNKHFP